MIALLFMAMLQGVVTLNPTGGESTTDGLRVVIGDTGQIQIYRNGCAQLYGPAPAASTQTGLANGFFVAVGPTGSANVIGPKIGSLNTATVQNWIPDGLTISPDNTVATLKLRSTASDTTAFKATLTYTYASQLSQFFTLSIAVQAPAGNTQPVRMYVAYDTMLTDGQHCTASTPYSWANDHGPSFHELAPVETVGAYNVGRIAVEALSYRSGLPWTNVYGGHNWCLFNCAWKPEIGILGGRPFDNFIDDETNPPGSEVDNGIGVHWYLGVLSSTPVTTVADMFFMPYDPSLTGTISTNSMVSGSVATLTYRITNEPKLQRHTGLGFRNTLPAPMTFSGGVTSNTCGATIATPQVGVMDVSGAVLATGATSCVITRNFSATNTTASTLNVSYGPSGFSSIVNAQQAVDQQVLAILPQPPVVTLGAQPVISSTNVSAYVIAGTCTPGTVIVGVSGVTGAVACASGSFSLALNATSVPDGPSIAVTANMSNAGGSDSDSKSVVKAAHVALQKAFGASSIATAASTTLTFTLNNGTGNPAQTGLSFTDTYPAGLTRANTSTVNTCGGTLTNSTAGVVLAGGAMPAGTAACTVQVNVTSTNTTGSTISRTNGPANMSGLSAAVTNGVSNQVLQVLPQAPTVTLNTPSTITSGNVTHYSVSGTCSVGTPVTINVGGVASAPTCTAGSFSETLDLSSVADGPAVIVSVTQSNPGGTGNATASVAKNTSAPFILAASTSLANGVYGEGTVVDLALELSKPVLPGNIEITLTTGATITLACAASCTGSYTVGAGEDTAMLNVTTVSGTLTDALGNSNSALAPGSPLSASSSIAIDTGAPVAPTLQVTQTSVSGNAEPGATITTTYCTTIAAADGSFGCVFAALPMGTHLVTATATDAAGNLSPATAVTLQVVPRAPQIMSPGPGALDPTTISGTAAAGTTIIVSSELGTLCTTTADADDTFACVIGPLPPGNHTITATAWLASSEAQSTPSNAVDVTVTKGAGSGQDEASDDGADSIGDLNGTLKLRNTGCGCHGTSVGGAELLLVLLVACARTLARSRTRQR